MNPLTEQILSLSREQLIEAALALQDHLGIDETAPATEAIAQWRGAPLSHIDDIENLIRAFLLVAANDPATAPTVEEIVSALGRKAFIFGGAEILAAAAIAVVGMQVYLSKGRTSENVKVEITREGEKETMTINREVKYGLSGVVATVIETVKSAFG